MVDTLRKEGIFVIHALKGYEHHEKRINELFKVHNLCFEWVTDGDTSLFEERVLKEYFVTDIATELSAGVMSCTLNHIYAYKKMVERKIRYAIIFENDPFFLGNFLEQLKRMRREIESLERGFIISLENSALRFPSYWTTRKGVFLYPANSGRMAGAYLIDLEGATQILNDLRQNKCHTVVDWWHNSLIKRGIVKMYWAHPPLVEQGSHNGCLSSTISSKSDGIMRRAEWLIQKYYKMYLRRIFRENRLIRG